MHYNLNSAILVRKKKLHSADWILKCVCLVMVSEEPETNLLSLFPGEMGHNLSDDKYKAGQNTSVYIFCHPKQPILERTAEVHRP